MSQETRRELIAYRLEQAAEATGDAELLLEHGRYRAAANRIYYATFYAALAMLLTKGLEFSKHSAVIAFFDKEFIKTGVLPREFSRTLHHAFHERQDDDYLPFVEFEPDELRGLAASARDMVDGVRDHLEQHWEKAD